MSIRSIMVYVDSCRATAGRTEFAVALAAEHEAHLTGLHGCDAGLLPLYMEPSPQLVEQQRRWAADEAASSRAIFEQATKGASVPCEWLEVQGPVGQVATTVARAFDLTIVSQEDPNDRAYSTPATLPEDLVFSAGRPILVLPHAGARGPLRHILVGWNGSREAARAVQDALPLIRRAEKVTVMSVTARGSVDPLDLPGADICATLARHGVEVQAVRADATGTEPGEMLLSQVASGGADMIVMGAYGRSRLREFILGGATRTVLQGMTVPVLLSQ